ncbi:hypothetical protein M8A51_00865 [Schlegelella sp. S2-27]|uniref:DoxX family protein n=1 Tax=Caldimonas mangrovi TaxID=2944811 RepID=A0ABT0YH69_9BURK|nr:hypothetical protein [Caldimonas mangrovi]MCM5678080.1 hypothetical protein [Caldimonas mangrovi]
MSELVAGSRDLRHPLRFRTLLYRYWFFAWLFRDVGRGSLFERAAAWRHNQAQARWLPTYMRRWGIAGVAAFVLGAAVEQLGGAALLAALFFVPSAITVPVNAVIGAAWLGLKLLPAPV